MPLVQVHWVDLQTGKPGHGDAVEEELALAYMRTNQEDLRGKFDLEIRPCVSPEKAVGPPRCGAA